MTALSNSLDINLLKAELARLENERLRIEQIPNQQFKTEQSKELARTILSFAARHPEIREESQRLRDYAFQVLEFEKGCPICRAKWSETASKIVALTCGHVFCSDCQSETPKKCAFCREPSSRINTAKIIDAVLQAQCLNAMNPEALEVEEKKEEINSESDEDVEVVPPAVEQEPQQIRREGPSPLKVLPFVAFAVIAVLLILSTRSELNVGMSEILSFFHSFLDQNRVEILIFSFSLLMFVSYFIGKNGGF